MDRRHLLKQSLALGSLAGLGATPAMAQKAQLIPIRAHPDRIYDIKCCIRPFRTKAAPRANYISNLSLNEVSGGWSGFNAALFASLGRHYAGSRCDVHVDGDLLRFFVGDELVKTAARTSRGEVRNKRAFRTREQA